MFKWCWEVLTMLYHLNKSLKPTYACSASSPSSCASGYGVACLHELTWQALERHLVKMSCLVCISHAYVPDKDDAIQNTVEASLVQDHLQTVCWLFWMAQGCEQWLVGVRWSPQAGWTKPMASGAFTTPAWCPNNAGDFLGGPASTEVKVLLKTWAYSVFRETRLQPVYV